jgi:hypothetical protein
MIFILGDALGLVIWFRLTKMLRRWSPLWPKTYRIFESMCRSPRAESKRAAKLKKRKLMHGPSISEEILRCPMIYE